MRIADNNKMELRAFAVFLLIAFATPFSHAENEAAWVPENQPSNRHKGFADVKEVAPETPGFVRDAFVKNPNPILGPDHQYNAKFNPTLYRARDRDGQMKFFMVVRAEKNIDDPNWKRRSLPEFATSIDGKTFTMSNHGPIFLPEESFNLAGGIEDPRYADLRLQPFIDPTDGKSFDGAILYTGYDGKTARVGVAVFNHDKPYEFRKLKNTLFDDQQVLLNPVIPGSAWNKSPAVLQYRDPVTQKIRNIIYVGEGSAAHGGIHAIESDSPLTWKWPKPGTEPVIKTRTGKYDQNLVESAFAPVIAPLPKDLAEKYGMSHGIYLCLHGDSPPKGYQVGYRIFSLKDPTGPPIYASDGPFLSPDLSWEKEGQVGKVLFASGGYAHDGKFYVAYGAADSNIGLAVANLAPEKKIQFWKPGTPEPKVSLADPCAKWMQQVF